MSRHGDKREDVRGLVPPRRASHDTRPQPPVIRGDGSLSDRAAAGIKPPPEYVDPPAYDRPVRGCLAPFWVDPKNHGKPCPEGRPGAVRISCGRCPSCVLTRKNMLAGRLSSEAEMSHRSVLVTLTYRDVVDQDGQRVKPSGAKSIELDDARQFRDRMNNVRGRDGTRKAGRENKYCIVGELGELRGRAHFHAALFFAREETMPSWADLPTYVQDAYWRARQGNPDVREFTCCGVKVTVANDYRRKKKVFLAEIPEWPHGHVDIKIPDHGGFAYIAKYMLKSEEISTLDGPSGRYRAESFCVRSKNLGISYIRQWGEKAANEGIEPQETLYKVPLAKYRRGPRSGKLIKFTMTRTMKREMLIAYCRQSALNFAVRWREQDAAREAGGPMLGSAPIWAVKGELLTEFLDQMGASSPRGVAERFAHEFTQPERAFDRGGWRARQRSIVVDWGEPTKWRRCPDGAYVERSAGGVVRVVWRDAAPYRVLIGRAWSPRFGRELFGMPLVSRGEVRRALEHGGGSLIGLEDGDKLVISAKLDRRRSIREWMAISRVRPEESGPRAFGIPMVWPPARHQDEWEVARDYPLWWRWMREAFGPTDGESPFARMAGRAA